MNITLTNFDFDRFNYEVAFEFRDSGFLRRLLTRKSDYLVYYIRRDRKLKTKNQDRQDGEEILSSLYILENLERYVSFVTRGEEGDYKPIYWNNPTEPQEFLTRVYMKLKPSQDNVTFSTASLSSNLP